MSRIPSASLLGLALALASAVAGRAQTIPPSAYSSLRWRLIGPHRGGGLAGLETVVESADREPTAQARDAFAELHERVAGAAHRWQRAVAADVPALNARLERQGAPAVEVPQQVPERRTGP